MNQATPTPSMWPRLPCLLAIALTCSLLGTGCIVTKPVTGTAKAVVKGTVKVTGKAVKTAADLAIPDGDKGKDDKKADTP